MSDREGMLRAMPFLALLLLLVSAPLAAQPLTGEYRIGPRDLLEIKVLELPELNVERRVGDSGVVSLPLVGDVPVAGLTATESADRLELDSHGEVREPRQRDDRHQGIHEQADLGAGGRPEARVAERLRQVGPAAGHLGGRGPRPERGEEDLRAAAERERPQRPARDRHGRPLRQPLAEVERDDLPVGRHQHPGPDAGAGLLPRRGEEPRGSRLRLGRPDHPPLRDREGGRPDRPGGPGEHPDQAARARRRASRSATSS